MTGNDLVNSFKKLLGKPYVWGGESTSEGGFDCSGSIYWASNDAGYKVPRLTAQGFSKLGKQIAIGQYKVGDCLFFGTAANKITHCAVYVGNGQMIESRGNKSNTKSNPGTGVVISNINRRSDLKVVRRWWDEINDTLIDASYYKVGQNYTVQVDHLHVRWSAGGNIKSRNELTLDGMKHAFADGCLKKGTVVTCKAVIQKDDCIWIKYPSGWSCAVKGNEVYIS